MLINKLKPHAFPASPVFSRCKCDDQYIQDPCEPQLNQKLKDRSRDDSSGKFGYGY